eukprot:SAG11_NODE_1000_length_6221_cov_10.092943_4_plen_256_part_00
MMSMEELEHEVDAQIELQEEFGSDDDLDDIIYEFEGADDDVGNDDDVPSDTEAPSILPATSSELGIATKTKLPMKVDWDKLAIVQFHVDCEHGGEQCGLIQLSGVAYDPYTDSILGDDDTMNEPGSSKFNMYINPGPLAIWNIAGCAASHKLTAQSMEIIAAGGLEVCYRRESAKNQLLPRAQRRSPMKIKDSKDVKQTCFGCAGCNCRVCHTCWATYEHDYNGAAGDAETPAPKRNRGICGMEFSISLRLPGKK